MRIDLAVLGDYALVDKQDKLTVVGIFRTVAGSKLPFSHEPLFLALMMTVEPGDDPAHTILVRLIDPDGRDIMPEIKADLELHRQDPEKGSALNFILEIRGAKFEVLGTHCFDIFVDDRFMERVPLDVAIVKVTEAGPSAGK